MKVLVIGGGGREHALAWQLAASAGVSEVLVAPGNAGTASEPKCRNAAVAADDVPGLLKLAQDEGTDFTVVGPEAALAAGVVDAFTAAGLRIFGPSQAAAEIESSKAFTKDFLARHHIPTAAYRVFTEAEPALDYVAARGAPIVVKADGLAAGKGVVVAESVSQAQDAIRTLFGGGPDGAGAPRDQTKLVIEDFLVGEEASYIVVAAGNRYVPLASSQDHKRVYDGDTGPNTGGMGAYSPAPVVTPAVDARVRAEIIEPTLRGLAAEGRAFTGFLYAGLMIAADGAPSVVEFNARLGDPETQPILMRLDSDLLALLQAAVNGDPGQAPLRWKPQPALGVVMAAAGYPGDIRKSDVIDGLDAAPSPMTKVFHAGTRLDHGNIVTSGGRVLCVCSLGSDLSQARTRAYASAANIHWQGAHYRHDIGYRALIR